LDKIGKFSESLGDSYRKTGTITKPARVQSIFNEKI